MSKEEIYCIVGMVFCVIGLLWIKISETSNTNSPKGWIQSKGVRRKIDKPKRRWIEKEK